MDELKGTIYWKRSSDGPIITRIDVPGVIRVTKGFSEIATGLPVQLRYYDNHQSWKESSDGVVQFWFSGNRYIGLIARQSGEILDDGIGSDPVEIVEEN